MLNNYLYQYNFKRIQRFIMHFWAAFFLQYLMTIYLPSNYLELPVYPPIGSAFIMIYFLGNNVIFGLVSGGFCAYLFKGWSIPPLLWYLSADVGCAYIGVKWCQSVFTSDLSVFISKTEWFVFIKKTLLVCVLSGLLRTMAIILYGMKPLSLTLLIHDLINFCLADLNSILVFSSLFLSWIAAQLGREKILYKPFSIKILLLILVCISCFFLKNIVLIGLCAAISLYLAYCYGFLLAAALSYFLTILFLADSLYHQQWLDYLGVQNYTIVPGLLLLYILAMIYFGQKESIRYYSTKCAA